MYTVKVKDSLGRVLPHDEVYELFQVRKNPRDTSGLSFQVEFKHFKAFVDTMIDKGCTIEITDLKDQKPTQHQTKPKKKGGIKW